MADSKISGLTAVAAFATTQEFPVNDSGTSKKITGAQILAAVPQGTLGYAGVTANQTPITAAVDLTNLTVTVTVGTGRRIHITGAIAMQSTVANDQAALVIMEGVTQLKLGTADLINTARGYDILSAVVLTPTAGAHTYKLQGARAAGSGNLTMVASATDPAFILVEDIGT